MSAEKVEKVFRGTVCNYQIHHLSIPQEKLDEACKQWGYERVLPLVITGTIKGDTSGLRPDGHHVRTSPLTLLNEEGKYFETRNSIYMLEGENGTDMVPDLGDGVFFIYY